MNRNSIRWRLPASYALIALLAALSLGSIMILVLRNYYAIQEQDYLFGNAMALQPVLEKALQSDVKDGTLQEQVQGLSFLSQSQIRILNTAGEVLADSGVPDSNQMVAVLGASGLQNTYFESAGVPIGKGPIVIYSRNAQLPQVLPFNKEIPYSGPVPQEDMMLSVSASPYGYGFVAKTEFDPARRSSQSVSVLLLASDGQKLGVLEFSNGPTYGADVMDSVINAWLLASIFAVAIAILSGWFMSKRVTRPVLALENATRQMEQGNLSVRVNLQNEKQQEFNSLANSFNGMAEQVEQTVATLRAFVADAAHELHTPLTALLANLELARDERDESVRTRYLGRAKEQGRRLEGLVQNLLALSRIEAAEAKPGFAPVQIIQLAMETGELFASRAEQSERIFTMDLPKGDVYINGNAYQLQQVIVNLLENALNFTPVNGKLSLALECTTNEARLAVADSGIGIPAEDLPHLFKRFHRGRNASAYPGNGLGLAIVKAIVTLHQGTIHVQSEEMQGTLITISFPVSSIVSIYQL